MAILIAVGGGSGSGKTYITDKLISIFGEDRIGKISYDYYYKDNTSIPFEERCKINYDSPESLDEDLFIEHLLKIKAGETVDLPQYDYSQHNRAKETLRLEPKEIVLVDGILVFTIPHFKQYFDYSIFVDADSDIRFTRRLMRDCKERGRTPESVVNQYLKTVRPMHLTYVEPGKYKTDFVFVNNDEDGIDKVQLKHLMKDIEDKLGI